MVNQVETESWPRLVIFHGKDNCFIRRGSLVFPTGSWFAEQKAGWDVSAFSTRRRDKQMSLS